MAQILLRSRRSDPAAARISRALFTLVSTNRHMSATVNRLPKSWTTGFLAKSSRSAKGIRLRSSATPVVGHLAVLDVLGVGQDVLGEELAAGDADLERLLQAEDDVEEVDRLGAEIADQRRFRSDLVLVDAQGVDQRGSDLFKNFFLCRHRSLISLT